MLSFSSSTLILVPCSLRESYEPGVALSCVLPYSRIEQGTGIKVEELNDSIDQQAL